MSLEILQKLHVAKKNKKYRFSTVRSFYRSRPCRTLHENRNNFLCAFLPFLAVPLSLGGGKQLKILHIFTAISIFLIANHFLGIFQALIIKGSINWLISQMVLPLAIMFLTRISSRYREGEINTGILRILK